MYICVCGACEMLVHTYAYSMIYINMSACVYMCAYLHICNLFV